MNTSTIIRDLFGEDSDDDEVHALDSQNHSIDHTEDDGQYMIEVGMTFHNFDSLFDAYQQHARSKGFSVIMRTLACEKYARIVCDKAGASKANKTSKKVDCKARLNAIKQVDGSWKISSMEKQHNHEIDPTFSLLIPAHRHLSLHMKRQLEANDIAGIRPCKNVRLCEVQSGGPQNLGCLPKDCTNYIESRRRLRLGVGDAEAIRTMFARLQLKDRNFFYTIDLDDEGRLRNVLWIHPRSRAAYEEFHDVVSFDTTYLVNRYKLPFATFVGVNHHGHSTLFGCALVTNEDADSFRWLFSNWLEAMGGVHPTAIITDQCESIKIAIRDLMQNTIHRFCIWHILSKVKQKFRGVTDLSRCCNEFKGVVYDSLSIQTFEAKWIEFLVKYNLQGNEWLRNLYNERASWVPVYLNHTFWAGMLSTQRSEGMHAYFDEFVHSRSTLKQFMEQYEIAITNKIQKEFAADFKSKNKVIRCITHYPWELKFQKSYTHDIFNIVQEEIHHVMYCHVVPPIGDDAIEDLNDTGVETIKVLDRNLGNNLYVREFTYTVEWRPIGAYINCNCRKFEFKGILCRHIMKVMFQKDIQNVDDRYVLTRWRKDVYRRHSSIFFAGGYPHMTDEYKKFQEVEKFFQECVDAAMGSVMKMEYIKEQCIAMKSEIMNLSSIESNNASGSVEASQSTDVGGTPILNPQVTIPRGRPRSRCYIPASELARRGGGRRGGGRRGGGRRGGGRRGGARGNPMGEELHN